MSKLLPHLMTRAASAIGAGLIASALLAGGCQKAHAELLKLVEAADGSGGNISYLVGSAGHDAHSSYGTFSMSGTRGVVNIIASITRVECEKGSGLIYMRALAGGGYTTYAWIRDDGSFADAATWVLCGEFNPKTKTRF